MFVEVALPVPVRKNFDYLWPADFHEEPARGQRVLVSFGTQELVGIVCQVKPTTPVPASRLKPVRQLLDTQFILPPEVFSLCEWASDYYHSPLGEVLAQALPPALKKPKKILVPPLEKAPSFDKRLSLVPPFEKGQSPVPPFEKGGLGGILQKTLTVHQTAAVSEILKSVSTFQTFLLDGVTGSGKTEVYLRLVSEVLAMGKQALVLVPEIGLTPQLLAYFETHFPSLIGCIHSGLTPTQRFSTWHSAKTGLIKIVLGTRSALFTPFSQLGLIVVDEEHDLSYKQQDLFRYSARDMAVMRGHLEKIPIVLGTATPSLETAQQVARERYARLELPVRINQASLPEVELVDMRAEDAISGLSKRLMDLTEKHLAQGEQALFLLNRRGYAPILMCHRCGFVVDCKNCDAHLVVHVLPAQHLRCHHCDVSFPLMTRCTECGSPDLLPIGQGTARTEQTLGELFRHPVIRIDKDSIQKRGTLQSLLKKIATEEPAILVGTQMLAKGHHFPNVTLVSVLDADRSLFSLDFRSTERLGQLLTQVAGRAGRGKKPGRVLIQTYHPEHPLLKQLVLEGYPAFAKTVLKERKAALLPPFSRLALLQAEAKKAGGALEFLNAVRGAIATPGDICIWGPVPTSMEKKRGVFRAQMIIQAKHRKPLHIHLGHILKYLEGIKTKPCRWWLEVDPQEIY